MDINLDEYDLIEIDSVKQIVSKKEETLYDITIDSKDHTFFIKMPNSESYVLVHNCDGINIASMLLGWWYKLCPNLYKQHKIYRLTTPIVIVEDAKENIKNWFFNLNDFKKWESKNNDKKLKIIYLKGLGSLSTRQLDYIIQKQGFESLLEEYVLDGKSDEYFKNWLGPDAEPRKKYMKEYEFDINSI